MNGSGRTAAQLRETGRLLGTRDAIAELGTVLVRGREVELHWGEDAKLLTVLLEGIPPAVEAQAETASFLLRGFGEVRELSNEEAENLGP